MQRTPPQSRDPSPKPEDETNVAKDQRASRRQQGLVPEFGLLPEKTTAIKAKSTTRMAAPASPILLQQPREPPTFRGSSAEDPETWLETYERTATFNKWSDDDKLRHVYFSLEDGARTWFENRERALTTWDLFRAAFLDTFTSVVRKERAAALLENRVQLPNESIGMYTEEMTRLFRHADPAMPEDKKVRLLMRGVKQELFAGLVRNPPTTVQDFLSEATTIEKALDMRNRQYNRRSTPHYAEVQGLPHDLRDIIRAIVREELQKLLPSSQPQVASIADIVREEIQQSLGLPESPQPEPEALTYAAVTRRQGPPPRSRQGPVTPQFRRPPPPPPARPPVAQRSYQRKTDIWRAPDHRPLCYHCGEAGHVYRRCPYREMGLRGFAVNAPRPQLGERPRDIADYLAGAQWQPRRPSRSPSPGRYISPHRRQYTGPTRGRSPSPYPGN
ncbi:uncharacterized protein LOC125947608 [Dermacentor silvarum]|uniref:uncharacterized protein LOC125947608 n=1 Tax=Dermacentor silvarum TaxID=543639 RepID=UPI002100F510|nr:uncharacterized protein LOC125947608 [Dermacentor silvarum]XP_049528706.1 uncharacterized protein LOC125947608 [Dermacentor silvarum]